MQRAEFPAAVSESGDVPDSSNQTEDTEPGEDTEPRADAEGSETELREVEPAASTSQLPRTQIVLPRHTSVSGMDPSFIGYYQGTWYDALSDGKFNDQERVDIADGQQGYQKL